MTDIFKLYKYSKSTKLFFTNDLTLQRIQNGINVNFLYINNYLIKYLFCTLPTESY